MKELYIITPLQIKSFLETLQSITGVKAETIFTVLTTLFVFGAGTFINWFINFFKERQQRINYQKTINLLLANLSRVCMLQHKTTLKDINTFSLLDAKIKAFQVHVYSPLRFLNKMDYSLFLKYYVKGCNKKIKIKAAAKIFQIIGYTNILENHNEENIKFFIDRMKPMEDLYMNNVRIIEEFSREAFLLEVIDYDFKEQLISVFNYWKNNHPDNNFRTSFSNLISPLIRLLDRYPMEPHAIKLSKLTTDCHIAYSEIAHTEVLIMNHLKTFAFENRKVNKQLEVILRIFRYK